MRESQRIQRLVERTPCKVYQALKKALRTDENLAASSDQFVQSTDKDIHGTKKKRRLGRFSHFTELGTLDRSPFADSFGSDVPILDLIALLVIEDHDCDQVIGAECQGQGQA